MTNDEWLAEVRHRIAVNEGASLTKYNDSRGIPTIGVGFNLQRGDAEHALASVGADYHKIMAGDPLTNAQMAALFAYSFQPILSEARASLGTDVFSRLSDARRFVICDLVFNLGGDGWESFGQTRSLIVRAQTAKDDNKPDLAHALFGQAADHLTATPWYSQVGNRAKRDVAMMRSGVWVNAYRVGAE